MYGKKVKFRALFIFLILISLVLTIFLVVKSLEENVVYFKSPTDIKNLNEIKNAQKIRVGGMVKKNSIKINDKEIFFVITDFKNELLVNFNGSVPNLFEEGKGVVAEGFLKDKSFLNADKILAKHDENYMPPEVNEAMKNN
jgi:cytochrome c-type biogenesis protein CcmE